MKLTEKAAEAARINGARSHGPKTEEGKKRSSVNAFRHGLLSKCVVLPNESHETFDLLMQQYVDKLQPADGVEYGKIEEMVTAVWKMRRLWSVETRLWINAGEQHHEPINMDRIAGAFSDLAKGPELPLLARYEGKFQRMYQRALNQLLLYQEKRRNNQTNPEEPVVCQMEDLDLTPLQPPKPEPQSAAEPSGEQSPRPNTENCQRNPDSHNQPQNKDLQPSPTPVTTPESQPDYDPLDLSWLDEPFVEAESFSPPPRELPWRPPLNRFS
jgi:hypothetical protein